ncbi:MAG: hypothetical protein JXA54_07035 [Candidatus Heimdallarchaeota archaeon]|nr:hypothetical protein [Candidatus Heimdallarchaeota archaeon]
MTVTSKINSHNTRKDEQKEIENGILKAIADFSNEGDWPEGADAFDIQSIITQLARSAAHLRDSNALDNEKNPSYKKINAK